MAPRTVKRAIVHGLSMLTMFIWIDFLTFIMKQSKDHFVPESQTK